MSVNVDRGRGFGNSSYDKRNKNAQLEGEFDVWGNKSKYKYVEFSKTAVRNGSMTFNVPTAIGGYQRTRGKTFEVKNRPAPSRLRRS